MDTVVEEESAADSANVLNQDMEVIMVMDAKETLIKVDHVVQHVVRTVNRILRILVIKN